MKLVLEYLIENVSGRVMLNIPSSELPQKEYEKRMLLFLETLDLFNQNLRKSNAVVRRKIIL